jgi:energy-converting hydrogenase Eha subunit G
VPVVISHQQQQHMQTTTGSLNITQRVQLPTPPFFQKLRTIGLVLATISGTIVAAPLALPAIVVQVASYLAVAGGVLTAVSQTAVEETKLEKQQTDE